MADITAKTLAKALKELNNAGILKKAVKFDPKEDDIAELCRILNGAIEDVDKLGKMEDLPDSVYSAYESAVGYLNDLEGEDEKETEGEDEKEPEGDEVIAGPGLSEMDEDELLEYAKENAEELGLDKDDLKALRKLDEDEMREKLQEYIDASIPDETKEDEEPKESDEVEVDLDSMDEDEMLDWAKENAANLSIDKDGMKALRKMDEDEMREKLNEYIDAAAGEEGSGEGGEEEIMVTKDTNPKKLVKALNEMFEGVGVFTYEAATGKAEKKVVEKVEKKTAEKENGEKKKPFTKGTGDPLDVYEEWAKRGYPKYNMALVKEMMKDNKVLAKGFTEKAIYTKMYFWSGKGEKFPKGYEDIDKKYKKARKAIKK